MNIRYWCAYLRLSKSCYCCIIIVVNNCIFMVNFALNSSRHSTCIQFATNIRNKLHTPPTTLLLQKKALHKIPRFIRSRINTKHISSYPLHLLNGKYYVIFIIYLFVLLTDGICVCVSAFAYSTQCNHNTSIAFLEKRIAFDHMHNAHDQPASWHDPVEYAMVPLLADIPALINILLQKSFIHTDARASLL